MFDLKSLVKWTSPKRRFWMASSNDSSIM